MCLSTCKNALKCHRGIQVRQIDLAVIIICKLSFFGHTIRDGGCELVKCVIQAQVNGKRRCGRPNTSYSSNMYITNWMAESMEEITRDRAGWRRLVRCAA